MECNHVSGRVMPEASRCAAAGDRGRIMPCCCSTIAQRPVWRTRRGLQPQAEAVGGVLTRRAGASPFPVDPEGERSEFRGAESSRKSITPSMAEHGPRRVGRRLSNGQRGGAGGEFRAHGRFGRRPGWRHTQPWRWECPLMFSAGASAGKWRPCCGCCVEKPWTRSPVT